MLEKLTQNIKKDETEIFINNFNSNTINPHHRLLLAEIACVNQSFDIYDYLKKRITINKEQELIFFNKALTNGIEFKKPELLEKFSDNELSTIILPNLGNFIKKNDEQVVLNFFKAHPLIAFIGIKKIFFYCLENKKENILNHYMNEELDSESIFYFGLCSQKFKREIEFSKLVCNALNYNKNTVRELTEIKFKYIRKIYGHDAMKKREDFESFITATTIKAFADHLDNVLNIKNKTEIVAKPKKFKI